MAFWSRLLEGTSWQSLLGYVSPSFFQLVSPRDVSLTAYRLARNWFDDSEFRSAVRARSESIQSARINITIATPLKRGLERVPFHSDAPQSPEPESTSRTGEHALSFFFHQIHSGGPLFLDLRRRHFSSSSSSTASAQFVPTPLYCEWSDSFRLAVCDLYASFYGNAPPEVYGQALRRLGISAAASSFEKAFGGNKKHAATFSLAEFRATFHEVFERCLETKTLLQPDFLTLGIAIATLYDHLQLEGGEYDVAACYSRAVR